MQGAIARVCVVVAAAILNHPLLFPRENATLPEQDEELMSRMREHEERLEREQARLERELEAQREAATAAAVAAQEEGYSWYFWSAVSFIIFLTIEMCRVDFADAEVRPADEEDVFSESGSISPDTMVVDKNVLSNFCDKCSHNSAHENWRVREFVEGFADDLLQSLRSVCARDADMEVGDFVGIGSMFESWKACKPLMCDLIVPFSPPAPFSFQFGLWCGSDGAAPPDMQGCGVIKLQRPADGGCPCCSADLGDDVLCLLHGGNEAPAAERGPDELLCSKNSPHLSKDQVMKWFQISVTKAWGRISHKYDFEVTFRNLNSAGALKIRLRSGKVVVLNMIPAVQLEDTDAYFVSHFPSDCDAPPDPYWPLSLAVYERDLLRHVAKRLPRHSCHVHCLQVVTFLHRKQTGLTGRSALTNYHWKTAVLHLLLSREASAWEPGSTERRLRDVLGFMRRSLREKRLHHIVVGNRKVPDSIGVPDVVRRAEPVNLFRPLVLQRELHAATLRHFQEMLRNSTVLLQEYTPFLSNGGLQRGRDAGLAC